MQYLSFVIATAWAVPPELDPTITPNIGPREDAVGHLAKDPDATAVLIAVLRDDPSPNVRARAASVLFARWAEGIDPDTVREHRDRGRGLHGDDGIRAAAVRALGGTGDDYTRVVPYLDDGEAGARAAAYSTCERWGCVTRTGRWRSGWCSTASRRRPRARSGCSSSGSARRSRES